MRYIAKLSLVATLLTTAFVPVASFAAGGQALLTLEGHGLAPLQQVTLSAGKSQKLQAQTDNNGNVSFKNLKYSPETNLVFAISYLAKSGLSKPVPNDVAIKLNPFVGNVEIAGNVTRAASIILNVGGQDSSALIANQKGQFQGSARALTQINNGRMTAVASIINVEEKCCPRILKPYAPVTISISSEPVRKSEAKIISGTQTAEIEMTLPPVKYGVTVPADMINNSWVSGLYGFGNRLGSDVMQQNAMAGTIFDAQNNMDAQRAIQKGQAASASKYALSEGLCRYATLSQALVASDSQVRANKIAFLTAMQNREMGSENTLSSSERALDKRIENFRTKYCDPSDTNSAMKTLCKTNTKDTSYNQDVDYTRLVDVPTTLDIDFTNSTGGSDADEEKVIAMGENLFPTQVLEKTFDNPKYLQSSLLYRSIQAMRNLAKTSFISLVSEKAKGTSGSALYIGKLMESLGVPAEQVSLLMGDNPSYYAQMEVLTKKLYQDPAFYVNLVDTSANVTRQRAAIRAIKLQQQRDLLETVKRREMLLATLLELKLRERSMIVNQRLGIQ